MRECSEGEALEERDADVIWDMQKVVNEWLMNEKEKEAIMNTLDGVIQLIVDLD